MRRVPVNLALCSVHPYANMPVACVRRTRYARKDDHAPIGDAL